MKNKGDKMKYYIRILTFILLIMQISSVFAESVENDYGIVNAWYNGKEATVENIQLKINQPAEIKVEIISKIEGDLTFKLSNPMVTIPYYVIEGPADYDEWIDIYGVNPGWTKTYVWKIAPNNKWTSGNAPLNVLVQINNDMDYEKIEFTIANPYILDEYYSAPSPTRTAAPSSTDQPSPEGSPGFGALAALAGTALVVMWRRRRI
jgi:sarcinarray family protein